MEQRYTSLAEQQGRLAAEKDKLASANENLQKVRFILPVLICLTSLCVYLNGVSYMLCHTR